MFAPDLAQAFQMVDSADGRLDEEGFVIHSMLDRKYFKLKYPAYKEVLGLVFQQQRGQAASDTLQKAALLIYEGREEFPEAPS